MPNRYGFANAASHCPPDGSLARFLNDELPHSEGLSVEYHIQECETCHRALEALTPYSMIGPVKAARRSQFRPADDFLAELYAGVSAEISSPIDEPSLPEIPGYDVVRLIGRGGMGIVYQARDLRLNRTVALKLLLGSTGGESLRLRLRREAEALARLRHSNVIQIYEVGEANGCHYLSLEYVDGPSLDSTNTVELREPLRAAELVEKLAKAIHTAHRAGIVHRDLKPSNVLITSEGEPKIADFGLAKLLDEANDGATRSGQLVGTPGYAAPEQVSTVGDGVTASADVYALGAILYHLLTGRPPFRSDSTLETLLQVMRDPPNPPTKLNPQVPRDLETICLTCLHKDPAKRYASAEALADDLRRYIDGRPVRARPIRLLGRAIRWARRYPAAAGLIGLAICFTAMVVVGAVWQWREAERRASIEQAARHDAELRAKAESEARGVAEGRVAEMAIDHGLTLCSQGSVGPGLIALADAVAATVSDSDAVRLARINMGAWQHYVAGRRHSLIHPEEVKAIAFSPDGGGVATGCRDGIIRFFDTATGTPNGPEIRQPGVFALAFLKNGRAVVSAGKDGTAQIWEYPSGKPIGERMNHGGTVNVLVLDATGSFIATGGDDGKVRLWDAETGTAKLEPIHHGDAIHSIAFSPDGRRLISGGDDRKARIWNTATGESAGMPMSQGAPVSEVAAGPHGMVAAGSNWGLSARLPLTVLDTSRQGSFSNIGSVSAVAFDLNGRYMVAALGDGEKPRGVSLYRIDGAEVSVRMLPYEAVAHTLAVSQSGRHLLVAGDGMQPVVWCEVADRPAKIAFSDPSDGPVAFSQNGSRVATSRRDRRGTGWTVVLWDIPATADGSQTFDQKGVDRMDVGPNGTALFSGPKGARLWNTESGQPLGASWSSVSPVVACSWGDRPRAWVADGLKLIGLDARTGKATDDPIELPKGFRTLAISRDGRIVAIASGESIHVLDTAERREIARHSTGEPSAAFHLSPDGQWLAFGGSSGVLCVRPIKDGTAMDGTLTRKAAVTKVCFGPDSTRLAVSYADKSVVIWDPVQTRSIGQPMAHSSTLLQTKWSPDGKVLTTLDVSGTARMWDVPTGHQIGPAIPRAASSLAVSHDGRQLFTGDHNREVRTWQMPDLLEIPASYLPGWARRQVGH